MKSEVFGMTYIQKAESSWDQRASTWDKSLKDPQFYTNLDAGYARFDIFCEKILQNKKIFSALDIGCGTGESTRNLIGKAKLVFGIDLSKNMISKAQEKFKDAIFIKGMGHKLPFADNYFNVVISRGVLVSHFGKALSGRWFLEVQRVLKLNGIFIFDFLNEKYFTKPLEGAHKTLYTREKLTAMLKQAGFAVEAISDSETNRTNNIAVRKVMV